MKAQDLNGNEGGKSATATVTINVRDVNDNLPTLEKAKVVFILTLFCTLLFIYINCEYNCVVVSYRISVYSFVLLREKSKNEPFLF